MIIFQDLPLPPSSNHCFPTGRHGRRFKSKDYTAFLLKCEQWRVLNLEKVALAKKEIFTWMFRGEALKIECWFCFETSRIWTKERRPKIIDASNFVKPMHDALAKIIEVDDKFFFNETSEKVVTSKDEECTILAISPFRPRSKKLIRESLKVTVDGGPRR